MDPGVYSEISVKEESQEWWCTLLIPVHRRLSQADLCELEASLVHMRLCLTKEGSEGGKEEKEGEKEKDKREG